METQEAAVSEVSALTPLEACTLADRLFLQLGIKAVPAKYARKRLRYALRQARWDYHWFFGLCAWWIMPYAKHFWKLLGSDYPSLGRVAKVYGTIAALAVAGFVLGVVVSPFGYLLALPAAGYIAILIMLACADSDDVPELLAKSIGHPDVLVAPDGHGTVEALAARVQRAFPECRLEQQYVGPDPALYLVSDTGERVCLCVWDGNIVTLGEELMLG